MLSPEAVSEAHKRIAPFLNRTPLVQSNILEEMLYEKNRVKHTIIFKAEMLQKVGAFKARGALNTLLEQKEKGTMPKEVVAYSSGNHAQGVAWACGMLGVSCQVFMPEFTSFIKQQATRSYGAKLTLTKTRAEAEELTAKAQEAGAFFIPPFDSDAEIAGQGTACLESLQDGANPNAVFAPCGGGGLLCGTYLAAKGFNPGIKVFGVEPIQANDASISVKTGKIFRFPAAPETIADGVRTPAVSPRTFEYLKKIDGFYEIAERDIIYWTQWLNHLLKLTVEPTSALGMAAADKWLDAQTQPQRVLVILSGGNIDKKTWEQIWQEDHLQNNPGTLRSKILNAVQS